mmetsp:Transcript_46194/g.134485  ORF Transcript_46194/g.134485 Transcript_46194/m.134485 type:complete len:465 (-) Transcript_46194:91-1485(-)
MPTFASVLLAASLLAAEGSRRRNVHEALDLARALVRSGVNADGSAASLLSTGQRWAGWRRILPVPFAMETVHHHHHYDPFAAAPHLRKPRLSFTRLFWRNEATNEWHQPSDHPLGITAATVDCMHHGSTVVWVPDQWAKGLELGAEDSIEVLRSAPGSERFRAQLLRDPDFRVEIVGKKTSDPTMQRELYISRRLVDSQKAQALFGRNLSGATPLLDSVEIGDWTFVLRGLGDGDLEQHFMQSYFGPESAASTSDRELGLIALIGILRGLRTLADLGIIHNGISSDAVAYRGGRPFIYDLSSACMSHDGDIGVRCSDVVDVPGADLVGQPVHYQAPEMTQGRPTGPENDVWAAGMFFLEICVGGVATRSDLFEDPDEIHLDAKGRDEVRRLVRRHFDLGRIRRVQSLPKPIQGLLRGMLEKDPAKRWSAKVALERALELAMELGLPVPEEQGLRLLPDGYTVFA